MKRSNLSHTVEYSIIWGPIYLRVLYTVIDRHEYILAKTRFEENYDNMPAFLKLKMLVAFSK